MTCDLSDKFLEAAYRLPKEIGRKLWKAIRILSFNPENSGLNIEKLRGKAANLWSFRVDQKYRTILSRDSGMWILLFVGAEEDAYEYAARAPKTRVAAAPTYGVPAEGLDSPVESLPVPPSPPKERTRSRTEKYLPLARYLLNLNTTDQVILTFSEIENHLGALLPPSARRHRPWWGNDTSGHVQALAWLSAGWKVAKVDISKEVVSFEAQS